MAGFLVPDGAKRMLPVSSLLGQQPTQVRDVSPDFWFSPLQPVQPTAPSNYRPRQFAYNPGANLIWQPKADEGYGFDLLRVLADSWDLLRIALEMKKDEIQDVEFDIRLRRVEGESGADYKKRAQGNKQLQDVIQFWRKPDGRHTWKQWLRMLCEDLLVIDAMACYIARDSTKKIAAFMPTDGATWNRLLTDQGVTPGDDGGAAFQQVIYGFPAFDATQNDVVYSMQNERTFRRYGFGRVERILLTVAFGLRRQHWQISEYTSGSIPEAFLFMPPDIAPERLSDLQNWLDATLSGNLDARRKVRIMPGFGTDGKPNIVFPKEALLKDELDEWLAKLVCATVGVSSAPFMKQMNRASAEEGNDASREKYLKPDIDHICEYVNTCLEKMGLADYEMVAKEQRETDPLKQAQADDLRIGKVKTVNEIREDAGEDPIDSPNANRLGTFTPTGFVPLDLNDDDVAQMQALKGPAPIPGGPAGTDGKTPPKLGAPKGKPPGKGGSSGVKPRATPAGSTAAEGKKPAGRKLLGESELEKAAHNYGIVMIDIDPKSEVGLRMEAIRDAIPDEHLMEGNGTKREENPHVTVRYGIVGDVGTIPEYLATISPFSMRFGPTMAFDPSPNSDGAAPLVIRIDCQELEQINAMLPEYAEFKKSDFVYHPHATLAYVKPEFVAQYVGDTYCDGIEYPVEHVDVRDVDDNVDVVMLAGDFYQTEKAAKPLTGGNWVTVNGAHVYIDEKGIVIHGPRHLMGTKPEQRTPVSSSAERHPGRHARTDADRIERAKKSHVLADAHIQKLADENEASLSKHLGVQRTRDNSPFDLQDGSKVGIELKLVAVQKNDKITMSKSAMALKRDAIKTQKIKSVFTIVTDARSARKSYLVRDGVGSFRLSSMKQVTLSELKDIIARRKI